MPRKGRSVAAKVAVPRRLVFGDLHVAAETLDRTLEVLARIRELASTRHEVVCTGDFWDKRGLLEVRQLDRVLDELHRWQEAGVRATIIPGNHDQVSVDGRVHGVRVFEAFENIRVATEPIYEAATRTAYLPWREDSAEQAALFDAVPGPDWVIFAHAEVQGATTNIHHKAPGRVTQALIESKAKACYVGHYHKRQQLGACTFYIGSPFEMNFGERDQPHGAAFVEAGVPEWIDWDDFPKHVRVTVGDDLSAVRDIDVVEVLYQAGGEEEAKGVIDELPAADIRPRMVATAGEVEAPAFALTLDGAIDEISGDDIERAALGKSLLSEVKGARDIPALGKVARLLSVHAENFCALRGKVSHDFDQQGLQLLRGPQGSGKTSLIDSITWCLYNVTTPRKAGSDTASLKGDEVVNDYAKAASVVCVFEVDGKHVHIERTKKRGSGSKVTIKGIAEPDGIADQQDLIEHVVGLPYGMWRSCVSLGQGAVGNFVTSADKKRKELLSAAFGLETCPEAQKVTRTRLTAVRSKADKLQSTLTGLQSGIEVLKSQDFSPQIAEWEAHKTQVLKGLAESQAAAQTTITGIDQHLAGEAQWKEVQAQHGSHVKAVTAKLAALSSGERMGRLQAQYGGLQAEKSVAERDAGLRRVELQNAMAQRDAGALPCPTCGRAFDTSAQEQHLDDLEKAIVSADASVSSFTSQIANVQVQIEALRTAGTDERVALEGQLKESQDALQQCQTALEKFAELRANQAAAKARYDEATAQVTRKQSEVCPWYAKQEELKQRVEEMNADHMRVTGELSAAEDECDQLAFWENAFGPKGIPALVLRTVIFELEERANAFLSQLTRGQIACQLSMLSDDLKIEFRKFDGEQFRERRYEQLSGGERRCVELAFSPFALSEMVFNRCKTRVPLLIVDELTTHLGQAEKGYACELIRSLDRETVLVVDHDVSVQSEFDCVVDMEDKLCT